MVGVVETSFKSSCGRCDSPRIYIRPVVGQCRPHFISTEYRMCWIAGGFEVGNLGCLGPI